MPPKRTIKGTIMGLLYFAKCYTVGKMDDQVAMMWQAKLHKTRLVIG